VYAPVQKHVISRVVQVVSGLSSTIGETIVQIKSALSSFQETININVKAHVDRVPILNEEIIKLENTIKSIKEKLERERKLRSEIEESRKLNMLQTIDYLSKLEDKLERLKKLFKLEKLRKWLDSI